MANRSIVKSMDGFDNLQTADGITVRSKGVLVTTPYRDVLEGSASAATRHFREKWKQMENSKGRESNKGLLLVDPGGEKFPPIRVAVELMGPAIDPSFDASELVINWMVDGPIGNLEEWVRKKVAEVQWKDHARDFEY